MENIKNPHDTTAKSALPYENHDIAAAKSFQEFIKVLSLIIEMHGADVLNDMKRGE